MKQFNKAEILQMASLQGVIPPFNHKNVNSAKKILDAIYAGGLRIIEFTNRNANALEIFESLVKHVKKNLPELIFGVGTIMNEKQAKQFYKAGAQFIVAPVLTKEVGKFCDEHELFWCPGAYSPTEIVHAHELGADLVKIFPAETLGPAFIKALKAPCPWVNVMPSGGVTLEKNNLESWFNAGATCVAIGSQLFTKDIMDGTNHSVLENRIKDLLTTIHEVRQPLFETLQLH